MKRTALLAAFTAFLLTAGSALAETSCDVPKAEWQPEQALRDKLTAKNWTISKVKIDDGCYEVYGKDDKGQKYEIYFNPKTLEPIEGGKG